MKKILHSPFILSLFPIFIFIISVSCTQVIQKNVNNNKETELSTAGMDEKILKFINQHRKSINLPALQMVPVAGQQAYQHSRDMALRKTGFGHEGFESRMAIVGKTEGWITASAENVAYGKLSAEEVVKGWLNSKGHKKNIEGNYAFTGIGVYTDQKGVIFFTQIFYRKS